MTQVVAYDLVFISPLTLLSSISAVTLWAAVKQVQKSAVETGVSFKDYGKLHLLKMYMYVSSVGILGR